MSVGKTYRDPQDRYVDRSSGREIVQLTRYLGHSYQFYFTHPCWLDSALHWEFRSGPEAGSRWVAGWPQCGGTYD